MTNAAFTPARNRKSLTAGLCSASFVYGLVIALLGVVEYPLSEKLGLTPSQTSNFALYSFFPVLVMLFATGILLEKVGKKIMIAGGSFLVGAALLLIGTGSSYSIICVGMVVLGIGAGGVNGGTNTMVTDLYPENPSRALNLVNSFFGVGAIFLPFVSAILLVTLGFSGLLSVATGLCMIPVVYLGLSKFPPPGVSEKFSFSAVRTALGSPLVLLFSAIMFFYIALEVSTSMWASRFFQVAYGVSESTALLYVAGYWASLLIGRLVSARLLTNIAGTKLLMYAGVGACAGLAIFATSTSATVAVAGLWLTGLCFAPFFPTTLGTAGTLFKEAIGTVFGVTIGIGIIGSMVLPKLIGAAWSDANPAGAIWYLFGFAVLLLVTQVLVHRQTAKVSAQSPPA